MKKTYFSLVLFFLSNTFNAFGGGKEFIPVFAGYGGKLTGEFSYESNHHSVVVRNRPANYTKNISTQYRESLDLATVGYVYHPALLAFSLEGGGLLEQQKNESDNGSVGLNDGSEFYDFHGYLLRKKAINAEFYIRDQRPFLPSVSGERQTESSSSGIEVFYDGRPYRATIKYLRNMQGTSISTRDMESYVSRFSYGRELMSYFLSGRRDIVRTTVTLGADGETDAEETHDKLGTGFSLNYKKISFNSDGYWTSAEQKDHRDSEIYVRENLAIELPRHFSFENQLFRRVNEKKALTATGKNSFRVVDSAKFLLEHRLFESLDSTMLLNYESTDSDLGQSQNLNYLLKTDYHKLLRSGYVKAGLGNNTYQVVTFGAVSLDPEFATLQAVTGSYILDRVDADPATVTVEVEVVDPLGGKSWVFIERGTLASPNAWHSENGSGFVLVRIDNLTGVLNLANPWDAHKFRITYRTFAADYTLQTSTFRGYVGFSVFRKLVSFDMSHSYTTQEIVAGDKKAIELNPDVSEELLTFNFTRKPFKLDAEYRILSSDFSERKWEYTLEFLHKMTIIPTTQTIFKANFNKVGLAFESKNGERTDSFEYSVHSSAATSMYLSRYSLTLSNSLRYSMMRGAVESFSQNGSGLYTKPTSFAEEKNVWASNITVSKLIPFINMTLSSIGNYRYESFLDGTNKTTIGLDLQTNKSWKFGATSISFIGTYSFDRTDSVKGTLGSTDMEDKLDLLVKVTRQLF